LVNQDHNRRDKITKEPGEKQDRSRAGDMTSPASFVARIDIPEFGSSAGLTGFLVASEYVITCAHAAVPPNALQETMSLEKIQELSRVRVGIRFDDGPQATGTVVEYSLPDCALVRLDQPSSRKPVRLMANLRAEHEAFMRLAHPFAIGFPAHAPDGLMKSPVHQIVSSSQPLESANLFDFQIEGGLDMGMSGSPALVNVDGEWLCFGMAYLGSARAARSRLVSSQTLLEFVKRHGVNCLPAADADDYFRAEEAKVASSAEEQRRRFLTDVTFAGRFAASKEPIYLPDVYVHRIEQEEKIKSLIANDNSRHKGTWISVQGHAGSGKSSLLWYLHEDLSKVENTIVQPFAAQNLSEDFSREEAIVSYQITRSLNCKYVVLIDTLDLIVGRGDRTLASFIASLRSRGAFVVTACRPLEAQRLIPLHEPGHFVSLGRFSDEESKIAVGKYVGRAYPGFTPEQKEKQERELWNLLDNRRRIQELSFEPLILRMIFEAYPPDPIPAEINTALIYSAYWQRCVITDRLRESNSVSQREREVVACRLADTILFRDGTSFDDAIRLSEFEIAWRESENQIPFPHHVIESLQSSRVIESTMTGTILFFHQTLLEFAAARHILRGTRSLQRQRLDRILSDLTSGVFVRTPVLVQMAVQDAHTGGDTWVEVLNRLLDVGSESACYLSLEILGKVPENSLTTQMVKKSGILDKWKTEHINRLAECAVDTVVYYPKARITFGLTILESILNIGVAKDVFALSERLATIDPKAVTEFLERTLPFVKDRKLVDDDARGHYKSALLACADSGDPEPIRILGAVFSYLNEGQRQGSLEGITKRVNAQTCEGVGDFLRSIKGVLLGGRSNQVIEDYLTVLSQLHQIAPSSAESIANELLLGDTPPRVDDAARLRGWIDGRILKTAETIPRAIDGVLSEDHLKRLTSATTLGFSEPLEQDAIIERFLSLDMPTLSNSIRGSLFNVVADLVHAAPARVIEFISECPWPQNAAGKAWRKISAQLSAISPDAFKTWLSGQMREHRITRMIAVGINQLLLSQPGALEKDEFAPVFEAVLKSDIHCRRAFAETTGAIATVNPEGASEMVRQLTLPRHSEVWATLGYSLHDALTQNSDWVSATAPILIKAAHSRKDDGTFSRLLEGLRDWPEQQRLELVRLLEENLTEAVLKAFPQEKCQMEYLLLVKLVSKAAPTRAFRLLRRAVIETDGAAGAAASVAANIAAHTEDDAILNSLLVELLRVAPKGRQPTTRNAIYRGLRSIDEKLGHRYVIKRFFEMYKTIVNPDSLKPLIRAVSNLSSWTQMDTDLLLADLEHIKGLTRSYVMRLKKV
jgi:Trypsin-like peptidase domain